MRPRGRTAGLAVVAIVTALLALNRDVAAHPLDLGFLRITTGSERIAIELELDAEAAGLVLGVAPASLDGTVAQARAGELAAATYARAPITTAGTPCTWEPPQGRRDGKVVIVTAGARCAAGDRRWEFPFVRDTAVSSTFKVMATITSDAGSRMVVVDKANAVIELGDGVGGEPEPTGVTFGAMVWSGIVHIGVAPAEWQNLEGDPQLPDGIDHILFVIALLLGGGTVLQLVGVATGFTVGHSITLALAALGVVRFPPEVIEPIVALTIALTAVEAATGLWKRYRFWIATGFGLVHGFAFAFALDHVGLSLGDTVKALLGYNLGVELGQLVIVVTIAPLVIMLHRWPRAAKIVVRVVAALIFVLAMYWFFQRI